MAPIDVKSGKKETRHLHHAQTVNKPTTMNVVASIKTTIVVAIVAPPALAMLAIINMARVLVATVSKQLATRSPIMRIVAANIAALPVFRNAMATRTRIGTIVTSAENSETPSTGVMICQTTNITTNTHAMHPIVTAMTLTRPDTIRPFPFAVPLTRRIMVSNNLWNLSPACGHNDTLSGPLVTKHTISRDEHTMLVNCLRLHLPTGDTKIMTTTTDAITVMVVPPG